MRNISLRSIPPSLLTLLAIPAFAQPAVTILGTTQTQAVLAIRGYSGSCTIAVSKSPTFSPLHPDVNAAEYSGAATDTGRADTITQSDGTRIVTIGHMNDDRALAEGTTYYWQASGCGATASGTFATSNITLGTSTAWPVPFNSSAWGNRAWPATAANLLTAASYVDPLTGLVIYPASPPTYMTWRTGANGTASPPSGFLNFTQTAGGSGWTNPANAVNGATSNASTANTNSLDLYPDPAQETGFIFQNSALNDLGIVMYLGGTDSSSANRTANICIFLHPSSGCVGNTIAVAGASGAIAHVTTDSTNDADNPFPTTFPKAFFGGGGAGSWGSLFIGRNNRATTGTLACASGICTLDAVNQTSHFDPGMIAGDKIYIAGSSPTCANNMCTAAGPPGNAGTMTINENLTVSTGTTYAAYQWGLRIAKSTPTGTLTIGAKYKLAGSQNTGQGGAAILEAANKTYTTGDGKVGHLAVVTQAIAGSAYMVFMGNDGTSRELWAGKRPASGYFTGLGWNANDIPGGLCCEVSWLTFHHDPTDGATWYQYQGNAAGGTDLYKLVYAPGQLSSRNSWNYTLPPPYGDNRVLIPPSDNWTWSIVLDNAHSLPTLVASQFPSYNATLYGTNWTFVGVLGDGRTAIFQNSYACGQNCTAWILELDMPTQTITNMMHTLDGTGSNGRMRYGGLHNITPRLDFSTPTFTVTNEYLAVKNTSVLFSGPFLVPIQYLSRGGSWSSNTALPWPPDTTYDNACPGGNPYVSLNAIGNQCIKVRMPSGGTCNTFATSTEISMWPCPTPSGSVSGWTPASYSQPVPLAVGDILSAYTSGNTLNGDDENFRVVQIDKVSDAGYWDVWLQRNAKFEYCCPFSSDAPPQASHCQDSVASMPNQFTHTTGWFGVATPPQLNGCTFQAANVQGQTETGQKFWEIGRTLAGGHSDLAAGLTPGSATWIGANISTPSLPFSTLWSPPPPDVSFSFSLNYPTFNATQPPVGGGSIQAYTATAPGGGVSWFTDANTLNNNFGGSGQEQINQLASRTLTHKSGNIYLIQVLGTSSNANYKAFPMIGYAGRFNLLDVSGPSSATTLAATPYSMCEAYVANECFAGSTAGQVYVNVPSAYDPGFCANGQSWANIPCVIIGWPGVGGFRQALWTAPDSTGSSSRFLSYFFGGPGSAYPFGAMPSIGGQLAYVSPQMTAGWGPESWFTSLPPVVGDSVDRTQFLNYPINIPAGPSPVTIQFGYSRYIGPNTSPVGNFFCTSRAESCTTDASITPFAFAASDSLTGASCANGCTIKLPVMAPNVVYYRIVRNGMAQDTQALAVP